MYIIIFMKDIKYQLMFKSICLPGMVFKTYIVHHAIILRLMSINFYSVFLHYASELADILQIFLDLELKIFCRK